MTVGLSIDIEEKEEITVVYIGGRLDAANAPKLELKLNTLLKEGVKKILLDFAEIDYLSSAGMRLLLSLTKKLASNQGFRICSIREEVMEIIKMAGFERILSIYETEKEAIAAFSS